MPTVSGMSVAEMIAEVKDQLANQASAIDAKVVRWLNMASISLAYKYRFPHLDRIAGISTLAGTRSYSLTGNLMIPRLFWIPSIPRKLWPITELEASLWMPNFYTQKGDIRWYIFKKTTVDLVYVPNGVFAINYAYTGQPAILPSTGDLTAQYSDFPPTWHPALVQRAVVRGMKYENNPQWKDELTEALGMERELGALSNYRPDDTIIMGGNATGSDRNPRPKLPSNFPRI